MATALGKSTIVPAIVTSRSRSQSHESHNSKWSVKTMCSLPAAGLRISNSSDDHMVGFGRCVCSKSAMPITISPKRGIRSSRCASDAAEIPFAPDAQRVLRFSSMEARQFGRDSIGSEHLLLGLLRAGGVFQNLGAHHLNDFRKEVIQMYHGEGKEVPVETGESNGNTNMVFLEIFGTDLTKLAEQGKLDPGNGRPDQIERIVQILCRQTNNNACLIREDGVWKRCIGGLGLHSAEGLARRIASGDVPDTLKGKKVIKLDMMLLYDHGHLGLYFKGRLKKLKEEIERSDGEIIWFIDEAHTLAIAADPCLFRATNASAINAVNILKPSSGELRCIVATTFDEYERHTKKDRAFELFVPVEVAPPSFVEFVRIWQGQYLQLVEDVRFDWEMTKARAKENERIRKKAKAQKLTRDLIHAINEMNKKCR